MCGHHVYMFLLTSSILWCIIAKNTDPNCASQCPTCYLEFAMDLFVLFCRMLLCIYFCLQRLRPAAIAFYSKSKLSACDCNYVVRSCWFGLTVCVRSLIRSHSINHQWQWNILFWDPRHLTWGPRQCLSHIEPFAAFFLSGRYAGAWVLHQQPVLIWIFWSSRPRKYKDI